MINSVIFFAPFAIFTVHSLPPSSLPVIGATFVPKYTARIYGVTRGWWSTFNEPQSGVTTVRQTIELSRSKLNGDRPSAENTKIFAVRKECEENVRRSLANFAFLSRAVKMDNMNIMDNQLNYDDPQFVTVLETCLKIEIATAKEELNTNMTELKRLKTIIRAELDKRKQLKEKSMQMNKIRAILSKTLTKSYESIREVSDNLEIMKANADDQYKLIQLQSQEYQNIVAEYKQTWHAYHAMYEKFPLAKARNAAKIKLEKLKIEYMVITFKKAEMTTIIKQKRDIDWIRTRSKIIEFATVMVERSKLKEKLRKLKVDVNYHTRKLHSIEGELQVLRKKEEDQKTLRKQKMLEMAPPKINIPYREIYAQNQMHKKDQEWKQITEFFDDNISVNTLALEELS
nr:PREDICTED: uncharacterized protein LOC105675175 isoform X1 [Linepithema humile]